MTAQSSPAASIATMFSLEGRSALVTGASQGIGRAIAVGLAAHGARVCCVARNADGLAQTIELIKKEGGAASIAYAADLRSQEGIDGAVQAAVNAFGGLDILVNNAADDHDSSIEETDLETWRRVVDLNLDSCYRLCRAAGPSLKQRGMGKVINVVSILAAVGVRNNSAYIAAKSGLLGFTKALALEWARQGVQVNAVGPGFIKTSMTRHVWEDEKSSKWIVNRTPVGRWGQPDDLIGAVVFLASPGSNFVTGQALYVDGGWLAQ